MKNKQKLEFQISFYNQQTEYSVFKTVFDVKERLIKMVSVKMATILQYERI